MNHLQKALTACLLLALAAIGPAAAYHTKNFNTAALPGTYPGDWALDQPGINICETNGPTDVRNTDNQGPHGGIGGLCTTGRSEATHEPAISLVPASTDWTRLDVCDADTAARGGVPGTAVSLCAAALTGSLSPSTLGSPGSDGQHGYTFQMGAFSCFIPTDAGIAPFIVPTELSTLV